jgi:hypothetical protein
MYEAPAIIGSCINCIAPGSLGATLALILIGAGVALTAERRKLIRARRERIVKRTPPRAATTRPPLSGGLQTVDQRFRSVGVVQLIQPPRQRGDRSAQILLA